MIGPDVESSSSSSSLDDDDDDDDDDDGHSNGGGSSRLQNDFEFKGENQSNSMQPNNISGGRNLALASVIEQGLPTLQRMAAEIEYQTRRVRPIILRPRDMEKDNLDYNEDGSDSDDESADDSLSHYDNSVNSRSSRYKRNANLRQIAESERILETATECLEEIAMRHPTEARLTGLALGGEPILLLECQVNRDARQAKLFWTLPYSLLLDERLTQKAYQQLVERVQQELVYGGGEGGRKSSHGRGRVHGDGSQKLATTGAKMLSRQVHSRLSSYYPPRIKLLPATDEMVSRVVEEYGVL